MSVMKRLTDLFAFLGDKGIRESPEKSIIDEIRNCLLLLNKKNLIIQKIDFNNMSLEELKDYCKEQGIKYGKRGKNAIIKLIEEREKLKRLQKEMERIKNLSDEEVEFIFFNYQIEEGYKDLVDRVYYGEIMFLSTTAIEESKQMYELLKKPITKIQMLEMVKELKDKSNEELTRIFQESPIVKTGEKIPFSLLEAFLSAELVFYNSGIQSPNLFLGSKKVEFSNKLTDINKELEETIKQKLNQLIKEKWKRLGKTNEKIQIEITEKAKEKGIDMGGVIQREISEMNEKENKFFQFQVYYILKKSSIKLSSQDLKSYTDRMLYDAIFYALNLCV